MKEFTEEEKKRVRGDSSNPRRKSWIPYDGSVSYYNEIDVKSVY